MRLARCCGTTYFLYTLIMALAVAAPIDDIYAANTSQLSTPASLQTFTHADEQSPVPRAGHAAPYLMIAQQDTGSSQAAREGAQTEPPAAADTPAESPAQTPAAPAAKETAGKPKYASIEEELAPQPKLGPRTLYDISPEARAIRSKELLANSNRPMAPVPDEMKKMLHQSGMAMSPMSLRDIFNWMTWKIKAKKGVKYEDVIESMDLKANSLNFKKVGHNQIWKDVGAITGEPTARVEVLSYCDAVVGRKMMDISPEFSVWIPCRITVYEDYNGDIWLMTLDWDVNWLQYAAHPDSQLSKELYEDGVRIRDVMTQIMRAGAEGAW